MSPADDEGHRQPPAMQAFDGHDLDHASHGARENNLKGRSVEDPERPADGVLTGVSRLGQAALSCSNDRRESQRLINELTARSCRAYADSGKRPEVDRT